MGETALNQADPVTAWTEYCDALKRAGQQILRPEAPADSVNRAEGFRYLSRLVRLGLEMYVESGDMDFPTFVVPSHETAKIGADNPDNYYQMARIDGRLEYRVTGQRGSVAQLNFSTKRGGYDTGAHLEMSGFLDGAALHYGEGGTFEIVLSQQRPADAANWLRMDADSTQLLVRQTFLNRRAEKPAQIRIERLDTSLRPQPLDPGRFCGNLAKAGQFVGNTARIFADWAMGFTSHVNQLPPANQERCQAMGGDPNIFFYHSYWNLAPDEVLVVEFPRIPACDYWNFQVNNYWMESLDYRYFRITLNKHSAKLNADGSLTLVLSHSDPHHPNWLETAGHDQGTLCFRWVNASEQVHPLAHVRRLSDFRKV